MARKRYWARERQKDKEKIKRGRQRLRVNMRMKRQGLWKEKKVWREKHKNDNENCEKKIRGLKRDKAVEKEHEELKKTRTTNREEKYM